MDLSKNILLEICAYLPVTDLLSLGMVNKRFYMITQSASLFKPEFCRLWLNRSIDSNSCNSLWKSLCVKSLRINKSLNFLHCSESAKSHTYRILKAVKEILADPQILLPELRRDIISYPTVFQNILAGPGDTQNPLPSFYDQEILSSLSPSFHFLEQIFCQNPKEIFQRILLPVSKAIRKCLRNYCRGTALFISESNDALGSYCELWEYFSSSIKRVNMLLQPLADMINEVIEANDSSIQLSFQSIMLEVWKDQVFEQLQSLLYENFLQSIRKIRAGEDSNYGFEKCKQFVEYVLDITLNEVNIHFKNYSKLVMEEPYRVLHDLVLVESQGFYDECSVEYEDIEVSNCMFPQVTSVALKKMYSNAIGKRLNLEDFDSEDIESIRKDQDFLVEYRAKTLGITKEDVYKYSLCKGVSLVDIFSHIGKYKQSLYINNH